MFTRDDRIAKLQRLAARGATPGERAAALAALRRLGASIHHNNGRGGSFMVAGLDDLERWFEELRHSDPFLRARQENWDAAE